MLLPSQSLWTPAPQEGVILTRNLALGLQCLLHLHPLPKAPLSALAPLDTQCEVVSLGGLCFGHRVSLACGTFVGQVVG
jgi:hypothetical protein